MVVRLLVRPSLAWLTDESLPVPSLRLGLVGKKDQQRASER